MFYHPWFDNFEFTITKSDGIYTIKTLDENLLKEGSTDGEKRVVALNGDYFVQSREAR